MKHNNYNLKQVEGMTIKPFYLRKPGEKVKAMFIALLILLVLTIANPIILIVSVPYLIYTIIVFRKSRRKEQKILSRGITHYCSGDIDKAYDEIEEVLKINRNEKKALVIMALLNYSRENYAEYIRLICSVKCKEVDDDLDIQLKLGEAYEKTENIENAKAVYEKLLTKFKSSKYLKEKMEMLR